MGENPSPFFAQSVLARGGIVSVQVLNEFASVASGKLEMSHHETRDVLAPIRAVRGIRPMTVDTHDLGLGIAER